MKMERTRSRDIVKARRNKRGELNLLWLIVTVVGVVMGVAILYFVYTGGLRTISGTNAPIITAQEESGVIIVNIKNSGVGSLAIYNVTLLPSAATSGCTASYLVNGQTGITSSLPYTLKPGQVLTITYTGCSAPSEVTTVEVVTSAGSYTISVT